MRRRDWLTAALGWATGAALGHGRQQSPRPAAVGPLLNDGEAALAAGDAEAAERAFAQAAALEHALDIELGIVRSRMLQGRYREALAFAAHVAGAHPEEPEGAVLYAWLLAVGGQPGVARRVLDDAGRRLAGDPLIDETRRTLMTPMPSAGPALLRPPLRVAPYASALPGTARVAASGVLVVDGRHALVPATVLRAGGALWLRNGRGQVSSGEVLHPLDALDLAVLRLADAWPGARPLQLTSEHDAFPGSPASVVEFSTTSHDAAWPWLCAGFVGMGEPRSGERHLGIEMPPGPRGGAVFSAGGRWIGLASRSPSGVDRLLLASELQDAWPRLSGSGGSASQKTAVNLAVATLYEQAFASVVQVLVSR